MGMRLTKPRALTVSFDAPRHFMLHSIRAEKACDNGGRTIPIAAHSTKRHCRIFISSTSRLCKLISIIVQIP